MTVSKTHLPHSGWAVMTALSVHTSRPAAHGEPEPSLSPHWLTYPFNAQSPPCHGRGLTLCCYLTHCDALVSPDVPNSSPSVLSPSASPADFSWTSHPFTLKTPVPGQPDGFPTPSSALHLRVLHSRGSSASRHLDMFRQVLTPGETHKTAPQPCTLPTQTKPPELSSRLVCSSLPGLRVCRQAPGLVFGVSCPPSTRLYHSAERQLDSFVSCCTQFESFAHPCRVPIWILCPAAFPLWVQLCPPKTQKYVCGILNPWDLRM